MAKIIGNGLLGGNTSGNGLLTGLVAYWQMSEASSTRNDSHSNALHLTESGTLPTAEGKVHALAANYDTTVDSWLQRANADCAPLKFTAATAFTLGYWIYPTALQGGPDTPDYYRLHINFNYGSGWTGGYCTQTSEGQLAITLGGTGNNYEQWHTAKVLTLNAWQLVTFTYDGPTGAITCSLNNGTPATRTNPAASYFTTTTSGTFIIGARSTGEFVHDGRLGPVAVWNRVLSAAERTALYNGGLGLPYASFTA